MYTAVTKSKLIVPPPPINTLSAMVDSYTKLSDHTVRIRLSPYARSVS